jgi:LPS-assembly lipoprotein
MRYPFWFLACTGLLLQSCGFQPVYGEQRAEQYGGVLPTIAIEAPPHDRAAQILKTSLEDRMNIAGQEPSNPDYLLKFSLVTTPQAVVVESDATVQRYNMQVDSDFMLVRMADHKTVFTGHARRFGSYSASRQFYSAFVASQDATQRTIQELAADIDMRVHAFLIEPHDPNAPLPKVPATPAAQQPSLIPAPGMP